MTRKLTALALSVAAALGMSAISASEASAASGGGCSPWSNSIQACISMKMINGKAVVYPDGYSRLSGSSVCALVVGWFHEGDQFPHVGDPTGCNSGRKTAPAFVARPGLYFSFVEIYIGGKLTQRAVSPRLYI